MVGGRLPDTFIPEP